jgi:CheY-like chemotaxis protein
MPHLVLLGCALAGLILVATWLVSQLRLTRRRMWANEAATALRLGDRGAIEGLLARIPPWVSGLDEVLLEAREGLERGEQRAAKLSDALREARRAFQEAPLALLLVDGRGRIEQANRRALVLFERTSRELLGRSLSDLGLLRDPRLGRERQRAAMQPCTLELDRPGGALSLQIWDASTGGEDRHIVAALETSWVEREPGRPTSDLEAVGRFAGSVAHDFNDLLTAVLGRASVMISGCDPASPLHRDLSEIMAAGEQARLLTHQLMALSRQTIVGRQPPPPPEATPGLRGFRRSKAPPAGTPAAGQATICVVEDDEAVRRFVTTVLEREGYHVLTATNGSECLELCRAHAGPIDLLVSDVHMPAMYGPELYLDLLRERPTLEALFISGYVERDLFLADHGRAYEFLQKPFTALELATSVRAALERRRRGALPRVLVVGSNLGAHSQLGTHLRSLGVDGVYVADGREALRTLETSRVEAVIFALEPKRGGDAQACSELLRSRPETRLIALVDGGDASALPGLRGLGVVAELHAPFSKDELATALERALGGDEPACGGEPRAADAA